MTGMRERMRRSSSSGERPLRLVVAGVWLLVAVATSPALAETVFLKDGRVLEGRIIDESPLEVVIEVEGRRESLLRVHIERIDYADLTAPRDRPEPESSAPETPGGAGEVTGPPAGAAVEAGGVAGPAQPPAAELAGDPFAGELAAATDTAHLLEFVERAEQRGGAAAAEALASCTVEGQPTAVRVRAVRALGVLGGPVAERTFRQSVVSRFVQVRAATVRALGRSNIPVGYATPLLAQALGDRSPRVVREAGAALRRRLEDPQQGFVVIAALDVAGAHPVRRADARAHLIRFVARQEGAEAYAALVLSMGDPSPVCRATATLGLCYRPDAGVAGHLERARKDADPHVRLAAAEGLTHRGDRSGFEGLLAVVTGGDPQAADEAWEALQRALGVRMVRRVDVWRAHFEARFGVTDAVPDGQGRTGSDR
jgi:hypothetical protein